MGAQRLSATTYVNGKVFTGRGEDDFVSAFSIENGEFTSVGGSSPLEAGDTVNLGGRTVVPGFLDVHTHPSYIAKTLGAVPCTPPEVNSIEDMIDALQASAAYGKGADVWIEGWGYDESRLAEHRAPTTDDLNRVSPTQPVYVLRSDCHSGVCNSRALKLAGITAATPDPEGGSFGRYEDGRPNGVLTEHGANNIVLRAKNASDYQSEVNRIAACGGHFNAHGIVAVTDMMALVEPYDYLQTFRDAQPSGLIQRASIYYAWTEIKKHGMPDLTDEQRSGRVKVGGVKLFIDGSMSNRTAWMLEPYPGSDQLGFKALNDADMWEALEFARRNKIQLAIHVMGDRAIQHIIDAFSDEEPWMGNLPSLRLEHATMLDNDQITQINAARMNFGVVSQVVFFFAEYDSYVVNLTKPQFRRAYATRTCFENLKAFALSSDRPATTWNDPDNVFVSIKAAVTRKAYNDADIVTEQAITVPQALLLYTGRARHLADLGNVGTIEPGNEGSFVVLDRDIFTVPPVDIDQTQILETYLAGVKVYSASAMSNS